MKIKYEDGLLWRVSEHTALESQCVTAYGFPLGAAEVKVAVPSDGNYVVDVKVERVRAPLPEGAEWEGKSTIVHRCRGASYGVNSDGSLWGFHDGGRYALIPPWALDAFRAEGLIK